MFPQINNGIKNIMRTGFCFLILFAPGYNVYAQQPGSDPMKTVLQNPLTLTMLFIIVILLIVISVLASVVGASMEVYRQKMIKGGEQTLKVLMVFALTAVSGQVIGQEATAATVSDSIAGVSKTTFYFMAAVIAIELLVIFALLYNLRVMIGFEKKRREALEMAVTGAPAKPRLSWWERLNKFKPVEQEANIDLGHDYDGIRELDNRLPPWWLYGFYLTIIFAVVYLWRFHVSHTGPSSEMEFNIAMQQAERQKQEYLKKSASNIDENTVKYLTADADITAGKNAFTTQCSACHGKAGEGGVGPNLTDDYWLHGGSIADIFKTIKYGVPEKGMKKWSDDFSPMQIAQIASFVKSIHGTNPPNAKERQGDLYSEGEAPGDGGAAKDSASTAAAN